MDLKPSAVLLLTMNKMQSIPIIPKSHKALIFPIGLATSAINIHSLRTKKQDILPKLQ